jgi:predicted transcriptional regulator
VEPECGGGLLLLRHVTPLPRRDVVYFYSGAHTLLEEPLKETDIASRLQVSLAQTKQWLKRMLDEGVIVKQKRPVNYISKESRLFK